MPPPFTDPFMPSGTIPPLIRATPIQVYRLKDGTLTELPNVEALQCTRRTGAQPSHATFRYNFAYNSDDAPHSVEEAISTTYGTPKALTVIQNDRLCIKATKPDDSFEWLFDGKALAFTTQMDAGREEVWIEAPGIERDAWKTPIPGMMLRDADFPGAVSDHQTDLPAHFNPKGAANASPDSADAGDSTDGFYPVFLDPLVANFGGTGRKWTLVMAAKYILFQYNKATTIKNPTATQIEDTLVGKKITGSIFDPTNPFTYSVKQIIAPDNIITGRDWPTALEELISPYGFSFFFNIDDDGTGKPRTTLKLTGRQTGDVKVLMLQAPGETLDRAYTNTSQIHASRSLLDVANEWWVEGALKRYEMSVVLECGFPCSNSDASDGNTLKQFDKNDPSYTTGNSDKYRLYILDETGEGHYAAGTATKLTVAVDLSTVIDNAVIRRRRALGELLKLDSKNVPLKAELAISIDYTGDRPGIWDGTGTWFNIEHGWQLLKDRCGIRITASNPNNWKISEPNSAAGTPYPSGILHAVELQAKTGAQRFWLRLTATFEGDSQFRVKALKRTASPISDTIIRKVDARDRYRKDIRSANSAQNGTSADIISRDDTDAAQAEADAVRYTTEMGILQGNFTIDHITTYYKISDRLSKIAGRELGFRTDSGETGENPVVPAIQQIAWTFAPEQTTHLIATDSGADRGQYTRALHRGSARP